MKKVIATSNAPKAIGPYSQAIKANGFVFVSGQLPINPASGTIEATDATGQTDQALKNLRAILSEAGCTLNDVVKNTVFLSDIANFAAMNEVYKQYFTENFPARSAFAVKDLPLGALVEIESIAKTND
ncbi:MAG: RidA family protein [Paludibacter sp.]|jgi:2-iminobutanoate/2-iminopropanoate deaminase|nr:RidA family protein [Paludibacter sp.]